MRGFTLLELLLAAAVAGILAALAAPAYRNITQRTLRHEARLALTRLQVQQEQHYAMHHRYAARIAGQADTDALAFAALSDSAAYELAIDAGDDGQTYVATARAAAAGRQADDRECRAFSVDQTGRRRSANAAGVWSDGNAGRCWR